jgi:hypothetical protein
MQVLAGERRVGLWERPNCVKLDRGRTESKLASLLFGHVVEVVLICTLSVVKIAIWYRNKAANTELQLRLRSCVQAGSDFLLTIPCERAKRKKLLSVDHHESTPLVRKVHKLLDVEAVSEVVGQHRTARGCWLTNQVPGTWLVQEHVMHKARPPCRNAVRASEPDIAD